MTIVFWNRQRNYFSSHVGLTFFLVILISVFCLNSWILYINFNKVAEQEFWVRRSQQIISELDLTLSAAKDTETGIRGYILSSGDESYLEPYNIGIIDVWAHADKVQQLTIDNPQQQSGIATVKRIVADRLKHLSDIKLKYESKAYNRVNLDLRDGKPAMDRLRAMIEDMKTEENNLLTPRVEAAQDARRFFYGSLAFTLTLSILVIGGAYLQIKRNQDRAITDSKEKAFETWIQSNMAQVSQMASENRSLPLTARHVLEYLAHLTHAVAANLYTSQNGVLQLQASYAGPGTNDEDTGRIKVPQQIPANTTLLGEAIHKNDVWMISDIPEKYMTVSSSFGSTDPTILSFLPLHFQGAPVGVIEFALFQKISEDVLQLLSQLREPLGIGISSAISRERMQFLLEETQQQAEELQQQQEELRSNNEELEEQTRTMESQQFDLAQQTAELERSRASLEHKAQELQKTNQYKSEFLAKMSHELRTPLNSLLILSTLLQENKERNLTEQQKDFARSIQSAGNDLLNLINDILDLSKIEARKLSIRPEEIQLNDLISHLARVFEPQINAKGLKLVMDISADSKDLVLLSDRQRLEQILRNLLSNAIKFTESGDITMRTVFSAANQSVTITVLDSGVGIPESKMDLIFEAFEQADGSVSRKFGGTGLGLTISRELAALLGGHIDLKSKENVGSEFSITLPLRRSETAAPTPGFWMRGPGDRPSSPTSLKSTSSPTITDMAQKAMAAIAKIEENKNTILIVEDDDVFRHSVAETASTFGFQIIEASTGEMALEILHRLTPSAILLDIKLPGISGLGLLELVKQMPHLRHVPIHMISALDYQQNALRMGALGYLSKPVTLDKVRSAMMRIESMLDKKVKRLLIIEDDQRQREAITQLVGGSDLEVITAPTGSKAVALLKANTIDCVILDLMLPDTSGFDLLEKLNSLNISLPPIVIYTGKDLSREDEDRLRHYSESIIIKGARSPERLLDEVNLFLHRVESMLPQDKQDILSQLRSQEVLFEDKTVLLVDDDLRNVFALTSALESRGFNVRIAKNGFEALDALKDGPADIVLMDLMMPKMDGLECIRRIRAQKQYETLPIVALTAKAMKEDHENCISAGANDYLPKPINLINLMSVIRVWMTPQELFK